jgi:hypothetical protein
MDRTYPTNDAMDARQDAMQKTRDTMRQDIRRDAIQNTITVGELCEALASSRVSASLRDGHYVVTVGEVRRAEREDASVERILARLRSRLLDASIVEDGVPGGEDIGQAI